MSNFLKITAIVIAFIIIVSASGYITLRLIIKSEDVVVVPNLIGKDVVNILEILTDLGLNPKMGEAEYSSEYPKNHVIFQNPEPGSEVKKGRSIELIISRGTREIITPNLKDLTIQQSRIILEENGLCLGQLSFSTVEHVKENEVITQSTSPGFITTQGECIDLLVSMGKKQHEIVMPDLSNLTLDDAILIIEKNNLVLGKISAVFYEDKPLGIITGQKPLSGYRVTEGTTVFLERNKEPQPGENAWLSERGRKKDLLFRYPLENGFLKKHIRIRLDAFGISNDLFDNYVNPGKEIWVIIPKLENATISLYVNDELIKNTVYSEW